MCSRVVLTCCAHVWSPRGLDSTRRISGVAHVPHCPITIGVHFEENWTNIVSSPAPDVKYVYLVEFCPLLQGRRLVLSEHLLQLD